MTTKVADHMTLKVNDVLQQMKTHCRNELTPVPAKYEEELKQLKQRLHNQEISPVQFTDTAYYLLHLD